MKRHQLVLTALLASSLIASGQLTIGRDLIFTGSASLMAQASWLVSVTGNVNVASGATLTVSGLRGAGVGLGGVMDLQGAVTGAGALSLGKADTTNDRTGIVRLSSPNANGISANTYSGGTTLSWGRVQINSDAFFTGLASAPTNIISSPFGTGSLTLRAIAGTSTLEAFGADRVVVNPMAATAYTINSSTTFFFAGRYSLNLANATQSVQLSTDGTLRSRTLQANNTTGIKEL